MLFPPSDGLQLLPTFRDDFLGRCEQTAEQASFRLIETLLFRRRARDEVEQNLKLFMGLEERLLLCDNHRNPPWCIDHPCHQWMSYAKGALLASCSRRKSLSDKELFGAGGELHPFLDAG